MRRYETITIMDPDLSEDGRVPVFERIRDVIANEGGTLIEIDEWGNRKLAYEIKKKTRGFYARIDYCGSGAVVDEMERFFRIDDRVIKYMTVLLDKEADAEAILAEKIQPEPEAAEAVATEAETAGTETAGTETAGTADSEPATDAPKTEAADEQPSTETEQEG
jgi:small subunit ribosomal protein S6